MQEFTGQLVLHTNNWNINFLAGTVKEFIAIHGWHMNLDEYQINTIFSFQHKIQCLCRFSACAN